MILSSEQLGPGSLTRALMSEKSICMGDVIKDFRTSGHPDILNLDALYNFAIDLKMK